MKNIIMQELVIPLDPSLLKAIGQLALAHARLEYILKYALKRVSGQSLEVIDKKYKKTGTANIRDEINKYLVAILVCIKNPKFFLRTSDAPCGENDEFENKIHEIIGLLKEAEEVSEKRNHIIHGVWINSPEGKELQKQEDGSFGRAPAIPEIRKHIECVNKLGEKINTLSLEMFCKSKCLHTPRKI